MLHAATHGADSHRIAVDGQTAERAVVLQEWFAEQQMRIIGGVTPGQGDDRVKRLCELLRETPARELTLRDLQNSHGFSRDEVHRLVEMNPTHLNLQNRRNPRGGPTSSVLILIDNPPP